MKITRLKTNHLANPIGNAIDPLTFSWVVEAAKGTKQKTARVEIAEDAKFNTILFDSGARAGIDSIAYNPAFKPHKRTRYHWRVTVVDDSGDSATANAFFETGKMDERWTAKWITSPFNGEDKHFLVKKTFKLDGDFSDARAYCSALGIYEIEVNGHNVTDMVLLPGYHSYIKQVHAQTFDITPFLRKGENTIGMHIGPGWYGTRLGWGNAGMFGETSCALCEVRAKTGGKDKLLAATDSTWQAAKSPVTKSSIYYGEDYDARLEIPGWSTPECGAGEWSAAVPFKPLKGTCGPLHDCFSPPLRIQETLSPEIIRTPAGETVLDFRQNMTGWFEITNRAPAGKTWSIQFGELMQDGNFYRDNLRSAEAQYTYTSNGSAASVRPHFTFYGFRYIRLNDFHGEINPADFKAHVIHSDLERTGDIKTSNKKVNRLFLNALWGQKGNFLDVPTDCPQRDERLGWTGDAQVFSGTACFNMDCTAFYTKYMNDLILEQAEFDGGVPYTVPALVDWIRGNKGHSSCAWGDVATVLPWTVYTYCGDLELLRRQYPAMKEWIRYIKRQDDENGGQRLWNTGYHFADWLGLDNYAEPKSPHGGTDKYFVASAYYARSLQLIVKAATALGEKDDAARYAKLLEEVMTAFVNEYFTPNGKCSIDTQTAHALVLHMDLVPAKFRKRLIDRLVSKIRENDMALTTGFAGTPVLCRALSDNGQSDIAYQLFLREKFPSWLNEVNLGATTIWERWNSVLADGKISGIDMNSMNHYAYGSIVEWMYRNLCGLRPIESAPGFRKVEIKPDAPQTLNFAKAKFDSPVGEYRVEWKRTGKALAFRIAIPFGASAQATLPGAPKTVKINGKNVNSAGLKLSTGTYEITYTPAAAAPAVRKPTRKAR